MSTTSTALAVVPEVRQPGWQPDISLPYDVLHIVLDFYTRLRLEEVESCVDHPRAAQLRKRGKKIGTEWPILPILETCKLFHAMGVPLLYRTVAITSSLMTKRFLSCLALASYKNVQELRIRDADKDDIGIVDDRMIQAFVISAAEEAGVYNRLKSSVSGLKDLRREWFRGGRFRIRVMKLRGTAVNAIPLLLRM